MDPNATLYTISQLVEFLRSDESDPDHTTYAGDHAIAEAGRELADSVADLDEWLSKGGFLPDAWQSVLTADGGVERRS